MKEQKKYLERNDLKNGNFLEVTVYYSKGGMSYLSGKTIPRGYYISVRPVTRGNGTVSFVLFAGRSQLLLETNRYSEKQFVKAVEMAVAFEDELIAAVVKENQAA